MTIRPSGSGGACRYFATRFETTFAGGGSGLFRARLAALRRDALPRHFFPTLPAIAVGVKIRFAVDIVERLRRLAAGTAFLGRGRCFWHLDFLLLYYRRYMSAVPVRRFFDLPKSYIITGERAAHFHLVQARADGVAILLKDRGDRRGRRRTVPLELLHDAALELLHDEPVHAITACIA
jgi:hypothetical protein